MNVSKILFKDLVLVKCLNGLAPRSYLVHYFITRSATHNRNLRRSGDVSLPRCRLSVRCEVFTFAELNSGMTCLKTFRELKILRFLKKDWLIV